MPKTRNPLSPKEELFIDFYTRHGSPSFFNGTQSAIKAGYSEDSARTIASDLLAKPYIMREINKRIKKLKDYHIDKEEILYRMSQMSRADLGQFADVTDLKDLQDRELSFLVKKVIKRKFTRKDGTEEETFEFELHDPQSALKDLAKIYKMLDNWQGRVNVDYSKLTDSQLEKLAAGEDILDVLLPKS